jgi:Ran GTPase-activating protein (RanGAP) involved in mRNA processing and transport
VNLTGLETVLLSKTSKITELEINGFNNGRPITGLSDVLRALARRPTLTKLGLHGRCTLGRGEARLLRMALCNIPSLQSLDLASNNLGSAKSAELAAALYHNTSIKVLDIGRNDLNGMDSATLLRDILRSNKTMTALDWFGNRFAETTGAVKCIADGLGSNSTLLKIDLTGCALGDGGVSILAKTLGSRNTTLHELALGDNYISSTGVVVLLETTEQSRHDITDLDLRHNYIRNEGAGLLARYLGNNALPKLTRLSLFAR